jgi:hypothetical protein
MTVLYILSMYGGAGGDFAGWTLAAFFLIVLCQLRGFVRARYSIPVSGLWGRGRWNSKPTSIAI